ncbi:hypothetical protein C0989_001649 [Termitomyces sp. Mn162]|nr:hypothetical protein C0989_001649 [Termitomyces sp. Mn162]
MSESPLEILKAGLSQLKSGTETHKHDIFPRLLRKEKNLDADETWLDNDANLVDEEAVIKILHKDLDYEHGLAQLNTSKESSRATYGAWRRFENSCWHEEEVA